MPRKTTKQPELVEANLSFPQMQSAIPKIDRRIADLDALNIDKVNDRRDPKIYALEKELEALLISIFGAGTVEYKRYRSEVTSDPSIFDCVPVHF